MNKKERKGIRAGGDIMMMGTGGLQGRSPWLGSPCPADMIAKGWMDGTDI